ncbi:hypothetical protein [Rhizobium phaseoli]|uniref:Uncharacterized protein n=1 Tax=Rhizobium phaseoli TaxID=396 RepID=A0ABM6CFH4_9HYPH|nr:hypothetical protein [Rhizobium phaseoli]ANL87036.1 hypothetical protein AMC81_PA00012 [Rhizobium phaseoli]ANL93545.1 hypothetical protein AMC80_PA00012 [Rhizobium phaseoli]
MNSGTPTLNEDIHYHCVSTSTDPDESRADTYFENIEDAKEFAEIQAAKFAAVWLWERGKIVGRAGYEDVWIVYWWNTVLAKDYGYGPPEGRGRGWANWMDAPLPSDLRNSTCEYTPLDIKVRSDI